MTIQYTAGPERKKLAAAAAAHLGTKSIYAGMPSARHDLGAYSLSREWSLTGPDDRGLVAALAQQGFIPTEESYDSEDVQSKQPDRLTIEVPIGKNWTPAKMDNLTKLIASRGTLLKKVLGTDALPIKQTDSSLKFAWFPVDDNAVVYSQLTCALVRAAAEATRVTAREQQDCASEKFRMRTLLLKLGFVGPEFLQASTQKSPCCC